MGYAQADRPGFGDFVWPETRQQCRFSQGMVTPNRPLTEHHFIQGRKGVGHNWAYLPDAGEVFAQLMEREAELEAFARFHFRGYWDADGTAMIEAIRQGRGQRVAAARKSRCRGSFWKLATPFNETLAGVAQRVRYGRRRSIWTMPGLFNSWAGSRTLRSIRPWPRRCAPWAAWAREERPWPSSRPRRSAEPSSRIPLR